MPQTHVESEEVTSGEKEDSVALKTFKALAKIPTYLSARFLPTSSSSLLFIQLTLNQRDLVRKLKRAIAKQLVVSLQKDGNGKSMGISSSFLPIDLGDIALQTISPSGNQLLILRAVSNEKGKNRFVETWKLGTLINVLDVTDVHGEFYTDDEFGGLYWSKDEQKAVYVAEQKALEDSDERKFDYAPSWGERFNNKRAPSIVVFDISTNEAKVLPKFERIDPGQVQFGPEDKSLIFTGYSNEPRRYGKNLNRHKMNNLTISIAELEYINVSWMGLIWVYLSNPIGGPHFWCSELYEYNFSSKQNRLIVPIVHSPSPSFHNNFPGIYNKVIPLNAFITIDGVEFILMHSNWRSQEVLLAINLSTVEPTLSKSTWSILRPFENNPYLESIVYKPKDVPSDKKPPLIVIPHGGPHGVCMARINLTISTLVSLGYFVVGVNYTGSAGFGQNSIDKLIGNIGNLEVEEVQ
ncbi:1571_t:CDS:10, partial [Dentiscutata heterogama]